MKPSFWIVAALGFLCLPIQAQDLATARQHQMQHPSAFEENKGQVRDMNNQPVHEVQYHYTQGNTHLFMLPTGIAYQFNQTHYPEGYQHDTKKLSPEEWEKNDQLRADIRLETYRMDMRLVGANADAKILAEGKSTDYVQYYNRNALDVRSFTRLTYRDIYPHIDWVIYTHNGQGIKYDFIVHQGGNPADIRLQFSHHESLYINADGSFSLNNRMGSISEQAPVSLQNGYAIPTRFVLTGEDILTFEIGNYNTGETLVIDPALLWATYYGGTTADYSYDCAIDGVGNAYLAGYTQSTNNIAAGGHQNTYGGGIYDAFLAKFNSSGVRQWATYYGGNDYDYGYGAAIDGTGDIYLAGHSSSSTNIAVGGHQNILGGGSDAFLVKFNSNGIRQWATYYGGATNDSGSDCATDGNGNVYLIGHANSTADIAFGGHQNTYGGGVYDAFLAKFNSSGVRQWATYYGGTDNDFGRGCTTDGSGNVYLAGETPSATGIASGGHQNTLGGVSDAFLVKFNSSGTRQWATYYGGTASEYGYNCATDDNGNVYLSGLTTSSNNIASGGHQNTYGGSGDAFLVQFNSSGTRQWATYYGGSSSDYSYGCAVDGSQNVYVAGWTQSTSGIAFDGHQNTYGGGGDDAFLVKFNSSGSRQWATYYGGNNQDEGLGCVTDDNSNVYLFGITTSTANIAIGGHQNIQGGDVDAFLVAFNNPCSTTYETLTVSACDSYTLNGQPYTNSGTYTQTLVNAGGCDSILTLNLTINTSTNDTTTAIICGASYLWAADGQTYTNSGIYYHYGTNVNGCPHTDVLILTLANTILSATITKTNMLCYGVAAGGASLSVSNGTMPYTYQWNSGQATASITGLPQGYYTVTATDANGCTIAKTALVLSPSLITIAKTTTSASCANNDGGVSVSATGGTGTKTFAWSNGMAGATITGLAAGNYTVTATDANGCERTMTINVASNCNLNIQANHLTCNSVCDGSITITPQIGTAPFSYQWSSNAANTAIQGSATGLCAGTYRVTVTDAMGAVRTASVVLTQPAALTTSITKTNATCVNACDGVATLSVSNGIVPYTYMWSNSSNTTASATGLCQGSYTITATDANGCTAKRSFLIVQSALALSATTTPASCAADGTATLTVSGTGVAPYSYLWSNGTMNAAATGLATGSYTVTATDANGCAKSLHVHIGTSCAMLYDGGISEMSEMTQTPNHLLTAYPNPCGRQVTIGWGQYGAAVRLNVYNSSGQLIAVQEHLSGSYEMIVLPDAAGLYWVSVLYADGVQQSIKVVSE